MEIPQRPWCRIEHIFKRPLREEDILTTFETPRQTIAETTELMKAMQKAIDSTVVRLGYAGQKLMTLGTKIRDGQIGSEIKQDPAWQEAYARLLGLHAPGIDPEESAGDLKRTDWNSFQFKLLGYTFKEGKLMLSADYSHSYLDTLSGIQIPEGGRKYFQLRVFDPMSVAGFTTSKNGFVLLGWRGGTNFDQTIHYIPVGSVEPHSERNPLYESEDKENLEELALVRDIWYPNQDAGLVTLVKDTRDNRTYAVFNQPTDTSLDDLIKLWRSSSDKPEHLHPLPLRNNAEYLREEIKRKPFTYEEVNLPLSNTSGVNYGAILPQCAIGLLAVLARQNGLEWARESERYLDGHFDLTSCFERN